MSINERLREERERLGFNQTDFAGLGDASLRSQIEWEKGKAFPNAKVLAAIAEAGADVQYILTGIRSSTALSPDEQMLIAGYRALDARGKAGVFGVIGGLTQASEPAVSKRGSIIIHGDVGQQFDTQTAKTITINMPNKTK